jgi:tRNA (guanine-N7-)-methyltransferase
MRAKRSRFNYNELATNIIQEGKPLFEMIKGNWLLNYFENTNPITIELACGYGEYATGLARIYPQRNFVGIDIKGDRLWQGSTVANEEDLTNVAFLRGLIHDLDAYFAKDEVSEIWLTFPDPRPKTKDMRRRLTSSRFLGLYKEALKNDGWFKLKTDDTDLFDYTLNELARRDDIVDIESTHDLATSELLKDHYGITTRYEKLFHKQGESIKYLKFRFNHHEPVHEKATK